MVEEEDQTFTLGTFLRSILETEGAEAPRFPAGIRNT